MVSEFMTRLALGLSGLLRIWALPDALQKNSVIGTRNAFGIFATQMPQTNKSGCV